ncbi:MAG: ubiquinol-cytochrome c reductase iron-sulfur subunit [Bacteroidetes bacterium]|nr:ubiquinol-cytochrome c reductase iron-sulfur subunit [Bacteroidota bacterium]MBI3481897.1 ubiquinol-cytochrome c reductase iron-sulfur subunit [Bacteroidota bacterium]
MNRRDFLKDTTVVCLGLATQTLTECSKESFNPKPSTNFSIDLSDPKYSDLKTVGGVILVNNIYIVCTGQSTYLALSNICTHAGCRVNFNVTNKDFVCPCHGGVFGLNGYVISGPPPSPLAQYQTTLSGTTLSVG